MKTNFIVILLFFSSFLLAQTTVYITGQLVDEANMPISEDSIFMRQTIKALFSIGPPTVHLGSLNRDTFYVNDPEGYFEYELYIPPIYISTEGDSLPIVSADFSLTHLCPPDNNPSQLNFAPDLSQDTIILENLVFTKQCTRDICEDMCEIKIHNFSRLTVVDIFCPEGIVGYYLSRDCGDVGENIWEISPDASTSIENCFSSGIYIHAN